MLPRTQAASPRELGGILPDRPWDRSLPRPAPCKGIVKSRIHRRIPIALASEDVRDAALSLALAHRTRLEARVGLALAVVPGLVGMTAISFGLLPQAFAPIASLLGGVMAIVHARSFR